MGESALETVGVGVFGLRRKGLYLYNAVDDVDAAVLGNKLERAAEPVLVVEHLDAVAYKVALEEHLRLLLPANPKHKVSNVLTFHPTQPAKQCSI